MEIMDIQGMPHKRIVIFDLDGTLALIHKRRELANTEDGKIDWDVFFNPANIFLDTPAEEVIFMAKLLREQGLKIVIFSGRSARTQKETEEWLTMAGVKYDELHMRPDDEADGGHWHFMADNDLKQHWLDTKIDKDDVFLVFDDRNQVVDMWRANGLKTFQVEPGKF